MVALYWDADQLVVSGGGVVQTFPKDQRSAAREAFKARGAELDSWKAVWPPSVPRGPNAPGALPPGAMKTLGNVLKRDGVREAMRRERAAPEGAVIVWSPAHRELEIYSASFSSATLLVPASVAAQLEAGLETFFASPAPSK